MKSPSLRALNLIKPEFRRSFTRFVETGALDESFEHYLNNDRDCQAAIEAVAAEQLDALRTFGRSLRGEEAAIEPEPSTASDARPEHSEKDEVQVRELYDMVTARTALATPAHGLELKKALATRLLADS